MNSIGIDIGTTSICGISVDCKTGKIIDSITLPNGSFIKTDIPFERIQDCGIIIDKVLLIAKKLCDKDTASIGLSNQMHGILYADKNANPLSPLYIWQDLRGAQEYKDNKSYAEYIGSFAGYGLVTDFYNRVNSLVPDSTAYAMSIGELAALKLCEKSTPIMHISNAAAFGCFDINKNKFTVSLPYLPEVTDDFTVIGKYKNIPVTVSLGDNQASFAGSVRDNKSALVNVGTGSQISVLCDSSNVGELLEARPFDGKRYLAAGCALCGGRAFAMVERFIASCAELATGEKQESLYQKIDALLENKKETSMSADTRFCGTRKDPDIKGGYFNIDEGNFTPGDMLIATMKAMSNELYEMYSSLNKKSESLVCSGNGIRKNAALKRITGEVFSQEVKVPFYKEEAAYGAALSSMAGSGIYKSLDEARKLIKYEGE